MSDEPLEFCPFCGSKFISPSLNGNRHFVCCEKCDARGPETRLSMEESVRLWNERAKPKWKKYARPMWR